MADQKLTERTELTNSNSLDLIHIVRHNQSYKMKASIIAGSSQAAQVNGNYALGGVIWSGTGLDYTVWVNECSINGVLYNDYVTGTVTLSDGDATNSRIDRFVVTVNTISEPATLTVSAIEGFAAVNPLLPNLNIVNQAEISFRVTAATETSDPNTSIDLIYNENTGTPTEWANSTLTTGGNLNYATAPYDGTKSFNTPATASDSVSWTKASQVSYNGNDSLVFPLKATLNDNSEIQIKLINTGGGYYLRTIRYNDLLSFGFKTDTATWQLVQIQLSDFAANMKSETEFNKIEFTFINTPLLGLDWIHLQGGLTQPTLNPITDVLQTKRITLTSAQIQTLGTTPIEALAAQGDGTVIKLISVTAKLNYWLSTYDDNVINLVSSTSVLTTISSFLNSATNIVKSGTLDGIELFENTNITITGTDSAVGTGTVDIYLTYQTIALANSNPINI